MTYDPILDEKETKGNYTKETLPTFNLNNCWSKNSINVKQSSALSGKFSYTTSSHLLAFNNILRVKKNCIFPYLSLKTTYIHRDIKFEQNHKTQIPRWLSSWEKPHINCIQ